MICTRVRFYFLFGILMLYTLQSAMAVGPDPDDSKVRRWTSATVTIMPAEQSDRTLHVGSASQTDPESSRPSKKRHLDPSAQQINEQEAEGQAADEQKCFSLEENEVQSLSDLPSEMLAELVSCTELHLVECPNLASLAGLERCVHLRSLRIDHCPALSNLEDIRHCTSLSHLCLSGVLDDLTFLAHCPNLIGLSFDGFDNFSDLEFLERHPYLQTLSFESCENLADLWGLRHCQQLRSLLLERCPNVLSLQAIVHCPLKRLSISHGWYGHCLERLSLRGIGGCKTLEEINFYDGVPSDFTGIEEFAGLQAVEIDGGVRTLPNFYNCHNLESFSIRKSAQLEDIRGVLACNSLQSLLLDRCGCLQGVTSIPSPSSLKELRIFSCGAVQNFAGLKHTELLERVSIGSCAGVESLDGLNCPSLKRLVLGRCNELCNIDALRNLCSLEDLSLSGCGLLEDVGVLTHLSATLQKLSLSGAVRLQDISALASLNCLRTLSLRNCAGCPKGCGPNTLFQDITPLEHLSGLEELDLSGYTALENLRPLSKLSALKKLSISKCEKIVDIATIAALITLKELNLAWLRIETIEPLRPLINLLDLNLAYSEDVRDIKAIEDFPNLKVLILTGCASIQDLGPATAHPTLEYFRNTRGEKVTTKPLGKSS